MKRLLLLYLACNSLTLVASEKRPTVTSCTPSINEIEFGVMINGTSQLKTTKYFYVFGNITVFIPPLITHMSINDGAFIQIDPEKSYKLVSHPITRGIILEIKE
jgi:hypothetical protein